MREQLKLRLWNRVVFLDWHGTLSRSLFWNSIIDRPRHPLYATLRQQLESLFRVNTLLVRDWMRGKVSSESIVHGLNIVVDRRFKPGFLLRRLYDDCREMQCDPAMLQIAETIAQDAFVVVATDNMDCFLRVCWENRELSRLADDLLCSSERGVLKSEDIEAFFGSWLATYSLSWSEALLIDDSDVTCERFRERGGAAIHYKDGVNIEQQLGSWFGAQSWERMKRLRAALQPLSVKTSEPGMALEGSLQHLMLYPTEQ